jgi:hypothetical protein
MARRELESPLRYPPLATCFFLPSKKKGEAERRQTQGTTAASCDAARALLERARLTAFHRGSHLRELFHPKGSASGQASWDAVCTGVTRLRLSQSRDAPPTPVVMPGDMMPKPPGSGLQIRPRAPHPLHLTACLRKASLGERDSCWDLYTCLTQRFCRRLERIARCIINRRVKL